MTFGFTLLGASNSCVEMSTMSWKITRVKDSLFDMKEHKDILAATMIAMSKGAQLVPLSGGSKHLIKMLSVLEIQRRREALRSTPPGFKDSACIANANNSSIYPAQLRNSQTHTSQGDTYPRHCFIPNLPPLLVTKKEFRAHMMSVIEVEKRRVKFRAKPPGFNTIMTSNLNNNSKEVIKSGDKSPNLIEDEENISEDKKPKSSVEEMKADVTDSNISKFKSLIKMKLLHINVKIPHNIKLNVSTKPVKALKELKQYIVPKSRATSQKHYTAPTFTYELAGETVTINILAEICDDKKEWTYELDDKLSPENYGETVRFYDDVINNRREILKAQYAIGDMLIMDELEGDSEEWKTYTEKCAVEEQEWKKQCQENNEYFQKTGLELRHKTQPFSRRAADLLRNFRTKTGAAIKNACPCFFK